jgi:hypothetical protein
MKAYVWLGTGLRFQVWNNGRPIKASVTVHAMNDEVSSLRDRAIEAIRQARRLPVRCPERAELMQQAIALRWLEKRSASPRVLEKLEVLPAKGI